MDSTAAEEKKAILTLDRKGQIISCNEGGLRIFGCSLAEITGRNIAQILRAGGEDTEAIEDLMRQIAGITTPTIVKKQDLLASRQDGSEFPTELVCSPGPGDDQETLIAMVYDLTRPSSIGRSSDILEAEKIYRLIAENVEDVVLILSVETAEIIYITESVIRQLGFHPQELMSKPMHSYVSSESLQLLLTTYVEEMENKDALQGGASETEKMRTIDLRMFRKDGIPVDVEATLSWIRDDAGQAIAVLAVMRDVSIRKRYEAELNKKNRQLEEYAHVVSHDLQTPLSGVSLNLDAIMSLTEKELSSKAWSKVNEIARLARANIRASQALVKDILTLAEAGKHSELISRVEVTEVVERVVSENRFEIEKKGLDIRIGDDLGEVNANPSHVYQVFSNLIGNAVKYCDNENPVVEVSCTEKGIDGEARYLIRDNGVGIRSEDLDRIFKPFYRGKNGGSGLGLATVQRILEEYQGDIRAFNEGGACFEFSIPDRPPPET